MDALMKAALEQPARTFTAVRIQVPDGETTYVLRLLNGGQAAFGGEVYTGHDDRFGSIDKIGSFSDGIDGQATTGNIVLRPQSAEAIALLSNPLTQGAQVEIRQGVIDTDTGGVYGVDLLFQGEINHTVLLADENSRSLRIELITEEARALEPNDERRLSHAFHSDVWPGELGLIHVTGVPQKDFWRIRKPSISYSYSGGGGGYGGGGGFGDGTHNYLMAY
ncbi:hypothetical protein [Brevundimonas sp.]|uniref:hypothetical protein n=1 Tax=Brevundimonas sp. TaxID=1871086 RepID=UPI0028A02D89|nr:hypothetical protein [Brevundimonas sp.]